MPNRILREGILDSEAVNQLSFAAEVFYRRLMSVVDDYGRFDGRPVVLRSRLYPLKSESIPMADLSGWLDECERAGLVTRYEFGGKPYVQFEKLGQPRAKESKYPPPRERSERSDPNRNTTSARTCAQTQADESNGTQARASVPYSDSYSGPYSGSSPSSGSAAVNGPRAEPKPEPTDGRTDEAAGAALNPMQAEQAARKLFERRWAEAGLRKFSRLDKSLWSLLSSLLADPWWAESYPAALAKAGTNPFLRDGVNRRKGAMDVSEFLRDPDLCRRIIDGVHDPHPPPVGGGGGGNKPGGSLTDRAAASFSEFLSQGREE